MRVEHGSSDCKALVIRSRGKVAHAETRWGENRECCHRSDPRIRAEENCRQLVGRHHEIVVDFEIDGGRFDVHSTAVVAHCHVVAEGHIVTARDSSSQVIPECERASKDIAGWMVVVAMGYRHGVMIAIQLPEMNKFHIT